MNRFAIKNKGKDILEIRQGEEGGLELEQAKTDFDPRSEQLILDALEANRWAFVFVGFGTDEVAKEWLDQFAKNLRMKRSPEMCRDLYEAASLELALAMRGGESFTSATQAIIKDREWWMDWSTNWRPRVQKRKWSPGNSNDNKQYKGQGKGWQDAGRKGQKAQAGKGQWNSGKVCWAWMAGHCSMGQECKFLHTGPKGGAGQQGGQPGKKGEGKNKKGQEGPGKKGGKKGQK